MARCPKCDYKLKITDIDQCCPKCGVNMRLFGFEENFYHEAKVAELSQAGLKCKIRRLKMAFIGSKLTIARLVVMLLPLLSLLVPSCKAVIEVPFRSSSLPLGLLGLYSAFSNGDLSFILSMASGSAEAAVFSALRLVLIITAAIALLSVAVLLTSVLCFVSIKNMQKITCVFSAIGMAASVAGMICAFSFVSKAKSSIIMQASNGFGLFITLIAFAAVFVVNLLLWEKGIDVEYDEGMVERSEIWKKVKSGEINVDALPYPVIETEETRKIRAEIEAERASYEGKEIPTETENEEETDGGESDGGKED